MVNVCSRSACKKSLVSYYRIWNDPTTELGYRDYCLKCGSKIIGFNFILDELKLKYEIITKGEST